MAPSRPPRVVLGRVTGAHGVRGELRVRVLGDGPENLLAAPWLELSRDARAPERDPAARRFEVEAARPGRPGEVLVWLAGVGDRDAALALRGALALGDSAQLPPLPEGEHYWFELVGCRAESEAGEPLGTVRSLLETGAHDVLVIEDGLGRQFMVPAVDAFVREVDAAGRRIVLAPPPGLLEGGGGR